MRLAVTLIATFATTVMPWSSAQSVGLCRAIDEAFQIPQLAIDNVPLGQGDQAPVEINANEGESIDRDTMLFNGDVEILRGNQSLNADTVRYTRSNQRVQADGNIIYREPDFLLFGQSADINIDTYEGDITAADVRFPIMHARASADTIVLEGRQTIRLINGAYTTCDIGNNSWSLTAPRIKLDRTKDVGTAYNATLRIKNIPVFYTPYINFPLSDKRKSGFLAPSFGSSGESGSEFLIPYYWNIAANYDATITPRFLSKRGLQLQNEFRYLTNRSHGTVNLEYLPNDDLFGDNRSLLRLQHDTTFSQQWRGSLLFADASDADYFEDLGDRLSITSITHLERRADLNYSGSRGQLLARVQDFQTIDDTIAAANRPYKRLPQLLYSTGLPSYLGTNSQLRSEWVQFDREDSVTASRLDIQPTISRRYSRVWGFFEPKLSLRHTQFSLDDQAAGVDSNQTRTLPISSLDSGLYFDKPLNFGKRAFIHTLEPRLFYLNVPFENQDDIPLFDTGLNDFTFEQLFRNNRFSGGDRVSDANQLALALTSRLIDDESGDELVRLALGQIRYFRDRRVTLNGGAADTELTSNFVARIDATPNNQWRISGEWQWDPDGEDSVETTASLQYRPSRGRGLNFSYRSVDSQALEQTDASFFWPLSQHWRAVGRWNYSLERKETLESFAGLEYEQCCWRLSFVRREFINDINSSDESNTTFLIQLELKGLTSIGGRIDTLLENGILDYQR
ncbi:MAG: LPS assembly protein LptD [Thiotrichales bacterium]|nr:LPS assembly protein LptD [Thiotrichales bacterium]